ncbi:MAG: hypothetical protein AMS24_04620 [Chlamydiae bacterium SM23_39]|nr:MAG: hypothetical protein AMS24_04620 [Chlamydiae bacterium SM23_39]
MKKKCFKCNRPIKSNKTWYGLHNECFKKWFNLSSLEKFENIIARKRSDFSNEFINSSFFHGKFRKYSSMLGKSKYILKVEEKDYPELPATEYLCNQIFKSLKINIPPFYMIIFEKKHTCFVTKNFMENFSGANLIHIYHFFEKNMDYDCSNILKIIEKKIGRISAKEEFIYLTLADSLIGNNDRHGRNLGFIQNSKGFYLAPFYDNPSYLGTEIPSLLKADHNPAGAIWTKSISKPSMKDYIYEWKKLGYNHVIERFYKNISLKTIYSLIENSYISQKRKKAITRLISKRSEELCI